MSVGVEMFYLESTAQSDRAWLCATRGEHVRVGEQGMARQNRIAQPTANQNLKGAP